MKEIIRKLSSRKLWLALAGVAAGLSMALGVDVSDLSAVAGAVTAIFSVVTYIQTEGKIDAERVKVAIEETQKAVETIKEVDGE